MSNPSPFKSASGEAAFLRAYDAAMKLWPVRYEELDIPSRFGNTHVIVSGPKDAAPLLLLHGYMATSAMWAGNIEDFAKSHRVYAVDVMGQPGKSIPAGPIRNAADYVTWISQTLNALRLDRVSLIGVSYGGWLSLSYAIAVPQRVDKLVLLCSGGLLPLTKQFVFRGMLMTLFPSRLTVNSTMHWLGIKKARATRQREFVADFLRVMHLGLKYFRTSPETKRVVPTVLSDHELRSISVPTLVLFGDREKICDPAAALARARRLIPDVEGDLVPDCSHDMCFTRRRVVDARVVAFLDNPQSNIPARVVA